MARAEIVEKVKTDLRITHTALDEDISDTIDSCLADLVICGVNVPDPEDPAVLNLIKLWTRAAYTDDTTKASVYMERYGFMKATLMMATGYAEETGGGANG